MTVVRSITLVPVTRPLKVTFATSLGSKDVMRSVLVKVRLSDGAEGVGECPTSFVLKEETIPAIGRIVHEIAPSLKGRPVAEWEGMIAPFRRRYPHNPMTLSGLEAALFRAFLAHRGMPEHAFWGGATTTVETDLTVPFTSDRAMLRRWIAYGVRLGFSTYKIKVSGDVEADMALITTVQRLLAGRLPSFTLRLDGNQGYTARTYGKMVKALERQRAAVELFEQPLPKDDVKGLAAIASSSPYPVVLDETVFTARGVERVAERGLGHGVNLKIAKSGIMESRAIIRAAQQYGLPLMIGCMTETMVGLSAAIHLAAGTGAFRWVDLDAIHFLHHRTAYGDIRIAGPVYTISPGSNESR